VQHKLLGLHQIRYHVTIWPYDLTWNVIAFIMILAGVLLGEGQGGHRQILPSPPGRAPSWLSHAGAGPLGHHAGGARRVWHRLRRRGVRWPVTRAAAALAGSLCAAAAVLPPIASHDEVFPVHVAQHLLLGMAAPAFLALSAPVTLALRTLPSRPAAAPSPAATPALN
jgi:hypothetical protein